MLQSQRLACRLPMKPEQQPAPAQPMARRDMPGTLTSGRPARQVGAAPEQAAAGHLHQASLRAMFLSAIRSYFSRSPIPMRTVFLAAAMLSALFVFTSYIGRTLMVTAPSKFDWWAQAPIPFLNFFTWALVLPLVYGWSHRWSLKDRPIWPRIAAHIGLGLMLCLFHEVLTNTLLIILMDQSGRMPWHWGMLRMVLLSLPGGVLQRFMEYWLLLVLLMYVDTQRQIREERTRVLRLQNELQTTQLLALKKQLQPHFLFNTLNTVSALMDVDPKSARTVLSRLGQLLRTTLDEERREKVTLLREVDHVGDYLGIETIRFKDRLDVHYEIFSDCQEALVPGMVLQPLVENSIKHGLDASTEQVRIDIEARRSNGSLLLRVSDNGSGCGDVARAVAKGGIGLRNVQERISLLYGDRGKMEVSSAHGKGFSVAVTIPFETLESKP
ncbi:MAG: sensor histidine kinase [Bacteroidetes bacterium]|nr:sensor histidine kinase [Bacteroidota bacterium]MBS1944639.1 sensor histidine kinase [Bacteroidota bacterium]